jgi:hypothetical protein
MAPILHEKRRHFLKVLVQIRYSQYKDSKIRTSIIFLISWTKSTLSSTFHNKTPILYWLNTKKIKTPILYWQMTNIHINHHFSEQTLSDEELNPLIVTPLKGRRRRSHVRIRVYL